ncbi:MAG: 3-deoxy-8-phosphooctulonate synthase [Elusimicrobia bacterium GWA2_66_18]|nr:MAG: 3-deoxy-8-phosphooctulonate synthase [Elusimicrobia bacterium GWA2_66_18]
MRTREVRVGSVVFGGGRPVAFIGGPCVIESEALLRKVGRALKKASEALKVGFVLKASYDKANRTSVKSYRGPGMEEGLRLLAKIGAELGVPVVTDVHEPSHAAVAARYVDMLQVPAFLSRQTDLLAACGRTGKAVNVKKGQFLSPWDMRHAVEKIYSTGNKNVLLTERGSTFGYGNLVVDMRSFEIMRSLGVPVVHDATHCVQLPGGSGATTGGQREFVRPLARAAAAVGVDGIFFETHPDPDQALSDGPNSLFLADAPDFMREVRAFDALSKETPR